MEKKQKTFNLLTLIIVGCVSLLIGSFIMFILGVTGIYSPEQTIAKCNGKSFSNSSIAKLLEDYLGDTNELKLSLLLEAVDYELLNKDYTLSENEQSEIESYASMYVSYYGLSEDYAIKYLTTSKLRDLYYLDYIAKNYITDNDVVEYYENSYIPDIDCEHILVDSSCENALAVANEIIAKLNSGVSFEDVASEYEASEAYSQYIKHESFTCSSVNSNADSDCVLYSDLDTAFTTALQALEVNTYSIAPVESSYGYHIILKKSQSDKPELDDSLKSSILDILAQDYALNSVDETSNLYLNLLIDLRAANGFRIFDDALVQSYAEYCGESEETNSSEDTVNESEEAYTIESEETQVESSEVTE